MSLSTDDRRPARPRGARGRTPIPVGVLYSLTGPYGAIGREMLNGVMLAVAQVNADPAFDFTLEPIVRDPGGSLDAYDDLCRDLLHRHGVRHVIGCYTSVSRRRVLPLIEHAGALLWHSPRYEGFESSPNVIYLGAAPNQHFVPMLGHVLEHHAPAIYNVGSNYVWSWEMHRISTEAAHAVGGRIVGERLLPLGETRVEEIVDDIVARRPAILLNTLVGESAYRFYEAWHRRAARQPSLASADLARLSLTLCEPEVRLVGAERVEGYLVSSVYFQSIDSDANRSFLRDYRARFGEHASPSVDAEAAWLCGVFLGRAMAACGSVEPARVCEAACRQSVEAPQGTVRIDADNNHAYLTPRLAICRADGQFDIVWAARQPVKPDPYLTWVDFASLAQGGRPPVAAPGGAWSGP